MKWRRSLIGLAVSAIFIVLLLRQVSGPELRDAFGAASPGWLAAAFAIYLGALWLRGLRWKLVLRGATPISTSDATALVVIGYAANNVLPVRAGELVRAQLLHERHGADRVAALGTILVERVFDGLVLALFLAGTIALAGGSGVLRLLAAATGAAFVALALALLFGGPRLADSPGAAQRLLRPLPARFQHLVAPRLDRFVEGLTTIRSTGAWSAIFVVTAASWAIEAAMYWLVGIGLGLDLDPLLYLAVCGAANLAIAAPSTSGGHRAVRVLRPRGGRRLRRDGRGGHRLRDRAARAAADTRRGARAAAALAAAHRRARPAAQRARGGPGRLDAAGERLVRAVVVGGGVGGLAAAWELAKAGHEVTLVEAGPVLGGQVRTFEIGGGRIESFYHHLFRSDTVIAEIIEEIGLGEGPRVGRLARRDVRRRACLPVHERGRPAALRPRLAADAAAPRPDRAVAAARLPTGGATRA